MTNMEADCDQLPITAAIDLPLHEKDFLSYAIMVPFHTSLKPRTNIYVVESKIYREITNQ